MKRVSSTPVAWVRLIIVIAIAMLTGCENVVANSQAVSATSLPTVSPEPPTQLAVTQLVTATLSPLPPASPTYDAGKARIILNAGNKNFQEGNFAGALNDYALAILSDRNFAEAYCRRGLSYLAIHNTQAAFADFVAGLQIDPYQPWCYVGRAQVYTIDAHYSAALEDLSRAEEIEPALADIYLVRGRLYEQSEGDASSLALAEFNHAIDLDPHRTDAYLERAEFFLSASQPDQAIADLNVVLAINPQNGFAFFLRGKSHLALSEPRQAISDYQEAKKLGYDSTEMYIGLGEASVTAGDNQAAIEYLSVALQREPSNREARYWRGLAYVTSGRNYPALVDANAALAAAPDYVKALGLRASIYLNLHRWDDAINDFQRAYQLDPGYVDALYGIAQAKFALDKRDEAVKFLKEYLSKAPTGQYASQANFMLQALQSVAPTGTP